MHNIFIPLTNTISCIQKVAPRYFLSKNVRPNPHSWQIEAQNLPVIQSELSHGNSKLRWRANS
jgi:hypothetical protein